MERKRSTKRTIKELSHFDNEKPGELESEFGHFDAANSYPISPFKGCNIVDLDFVYKQLLDGQLNQAITITLGLTEHANIFLNTYPVVVFSHLSLQPLFPCTRSQQCFTTDRSAILNTLNYHCRCTVT